MPPRAPKDPVEEITDIEVIEEVPDEDVEKLAAVMNDETPVPPIETVELPEPIDRALSWPHEVSIDYRVPHVARGQIATQLLQAADELGYPRDAIRSQTDGFLVPSLVYYHLFPSQIPAPADNDE